MTMHRMKVCWLIVPLIVATSIVGCGKAKQESEATGPAVNPIEEINRNSNLTDQQKAEAIEKLMRNQAANAPGNTTQ